ncbi:thiol-disulfide oxidoreductase DCC family protein [Halobacteriovorax sp. GFR7]|uniref:thiol-disulfide oxidoreductase DCC family protein n=1 Tax=unclassified Halobacteriovorax TaxID=2639665 RepID=UPI003D99998A
MEENYKLPILIFDDECPLCVRFKDSLARLEEAKSVNFVSVNDEKLYQVYPELTKEECQEIVHYITSDKKVLKGDEVITHLAKLYPLVNKFSWLIESNMGQKATSYFHKTTSAYRRMLKRKCPSCVKHA